MLLNRTFLKSVYSIQYSAKCGLPAELLCHKRLYGHISLIMINEKLNTSHLSLKNKKGCQEVQFI